MFYLSFAKFKKMTKILILFSIFILVLLVLITMLFPINYRYYIEKYSAQYNVDPVLIVSIINVESGFDSEAISNKGAIGLMQIMPNTGKWAVENLNYENFDTNMLKVPEINIQIGSWYLNQLNNEFNGDMDLSLAAYNAGSGNVTKWLENKEYSLDGKQIDNIPFKETDEYLDKVKFNYRIYNILYKPYMENTDGLKSIFVDAIIKIRIYMSDTIKKIIR